VPILFGQIAILKRGTLILKAYKKGLPIEPNHHCSTLGGVPAELDTINDLAKKHNIFVIEDAAHAFGSMYGNSPIGSHSDFVSFSFKPSKCLRPVMEALSVVRTWIIIIGKKNAMVWD